MENMTRKEFCEWLSDQVVKFQQPSNNKSSEARLLAYRNPEKSTSLLSYFDALTSSPIKSIENRMSNCAFESMSPNKGTSKC